MNMFMLLHLYWALLELHFNKKMKNRTDKERKFWDPFSVKYDNFIVKRAGESYARLFELFAEDAKQVWKFLNRQLKEICQ